MTPLFVYSVVSVRAHSLQTHIKKSLCCNLVSSVTTGACDATALSLQASSGPANTTITVLSTTAHCSRGRSVVDCCWKQEPCSENCLFFSLRTNV